MTCLSSSSDLHFSPTLCFFFPSPPISPPSLVPHLFLPPPRHLTKNTTRRTSDSVESPTRRAHAGNEAAFPWPFGNALDDDDNGDDDHRRPSSSSSSSSSLAMLQRHRLSEGVTLLVEEAKHEADLTVRREGEKERERAERPTLRKHSLFSCSFFFSSAKNLLC